MKSAKESAHDEQNASTPLGLEPLWTVKDVANFLRLKDETVRMLARSNKIHAVKVGKAWRFRASEIKEMLDETKEQELHK